MQQSLFPVEKSAHSPRALISEQELNPPQYEAVTTTDGPVLVIAGAGSGKTRTLVYRVAHLINQGVPPERILLLTFTRKSAEEMLSRASLLLNDSCRKVVGGTFHAVASNILRRYGHHLGYTPQFTIIDRSDAEGIINLLKSSLDLSGMDKRFPSKKVIINILSQLVNKRKELAELIQQSYWHLSEFIGDLEIIKHHYQKFKKEHNLMDYDDLLVNLQLVLEIPAPAREIAARFSYVMVDEYQDTNQIQAEIVRLISQPHRNVMVVGDDAQSIYSFRGADFRNIIEFPEIFTGARLITLEENYRSTQPILTLTNAILARAAEKYAKNLFTSKAGGVKPIIYSARGESEQAAYVALMIRNYIEDGMPLGQIAVLFRSGFHSYKLELELTNRQIPFEKRGGLKLTESAHIKDVLSYLRVVYNPLDNLSWNRILLLLEKVGPKTAQAILAALKAADDPFAALASYKAGSSWKKGLAALAALLNELRQLSTPLEQFELVMNYYQEIFERLYHDDYPQRSRDLDQVKELISGYPNLEDFLKDTSLDPPEYGGGAALSGHPQAIILSTVHSAKGLEWDVVFIIHLVEGKFPSSMAQSFEEVEEERRLLYVAATRAKKHLHLVYPRETAPAGRLREPAVISRFLAEIPAGLAEMPQRLAAELPSLPPVSSTAAMARKKLLDDSNLTGKSVRHPFFGEGKILSMPGPRTVQILFNRYGQKTINLDYVKMEIL